MCRFLFDDTRRPVVSNPDVPTNRLPDGGSRRNDQHEAVTLAQPIKTGAALIRLTGPPRVTCDSFTVLHLNLISRAS